MSHLQYFSNEGFGDRVREETHYSQAVRISDKSVEQVIHYCDSTNIIRNRQVSMQL